jgi:glycosyltransferase involved in cell wall biosynthesis
LFLDDDMILDRTLRMLMDINQNILSVEDYLSIPVQEVNQVDDRIEPLVSVIMLAWNHEATIAQAIESIISQKCDFPFELLIGEDSSSDSTLNICHLFLKKYPKIIRLLTSDANVGMHRNFARLWRRARGKYIAFCEGDDFWVDENKLAKQVAWFQAHPEFTLCGAYTKKIIKDSNGNWIQNGIIGPAKLKEKYEIQDLIPSYSFHFSSVMMRNKIIDFPRWLWDVYCVDRPLYLFCAEKGPVGFIPECLSVYRLHEGGVWSPRGELDKTEKGIALFKQLDKYFYYQHHRLIKKTVSQIIWSYSAECLLAGDSRTGRKLFRLSMAQALPALPVALKEFIKVFIRLYFPYFYTLMKL